MYASAIAVAPETLLARITMVEGAIRGATVRITSPNGTDLTLEVPKDAWVHRNTGDASKAKVADARSVRDREEELPASVFRTTDLRNARGTIIGYSSFDTRSPILKVTFAGGRVAAFESARGAEAIVKSWEAATGDKTLPGELVIGTNPALASVLPSGFMPYYGYGSGVVRLAIGDNWESGGGNRSSNGEVLLFIPDATVVASGVTIVKDGKLVTER
jgi:leucyl aminopeptidase (aminopeptidase T)